MDGLNRRNPSAGVGAAGGWANGATVGLPAAVHRWLWRERALPYGWQRGLMGVARLIFAVGRDLAAGQLTLRAMSLVYTTLLSLVPLLAISFSILKGFGVHNQIEPFLMRVLEPLGERSEEIARQIVEFVDNMQVGVLGFVGFVLLFYTVISLMQKIEHAFNEVWQISRLRSIAERFKDYLSVIVVGPVLIFTSLGITASLLATPIAQDLVAIAPLAWLIELAGRLVPILMVVAAFTFIYIFVPNTRVRLLPALYGGFVAGVLWNLVGLMFAAFIALSSRYTAVYSSFATPILFMIWLYVGWLILLVGASIAFYRQHPEYLAGRRLAIHLSFTERERVALHVLTMIGERFYGGRPAPTVEDLAQSLDVPGDVIEHILDTLAGEGLIALTDEEPPRHLPACPWEQATLYQAVDAVRRASPGDVPLDPPRIRSSVDAVMDTLDRTLREALGQTTLKAFTTEEESRRN